MQLGQMLVGQGIITQATLDAALERQQQRGGKLGTHLIAIGALTVDELIATLKEQQNLEQAIMLRERMLQKLRELHGDSDPKTQRGRYNLARAYAAAGLSQQAAALAAEAHKGLAAALGPDHAATREAATLLAEAQRDAARLRQALAEAHAGATAA